MSKQYICDICEITIDPDNGDSIHCMGTSQEDEYIVCTQCFMHKENKEQEAQLQDWGKL